MKIFKILLIITALSVQLWCGTTGKISGKITDAKTGEPLFGATVMLVNTNLGAASTDDGSYFIINVPPGTYDLKVSFIGFQSVVKKKIVVNVDRTTSVDFTLTSEGIQTSVVEVIANKETIIRDLTASSEQISSEQINKLPVEGIGDILSLQVGMTQDANGDLHLRGGRKSEIEYIVDGISVSNPFGGGMAVNVQNNTIQQMEVISGTFNAEYGRAMSGIVNIVTKDGGQKFAGSVTAYTGDYASNNKNLFFNINKVNPFSQKYVEGSFSGPIPWISNASFFLSTRVTKEENWLYGKRLHTPGDTANFNSSNPADWLIQYTGDNKTVPMNSNDSYSYQGKFSYTPFAGLRLTYSLIADYYTWQDYQHNEKYNPDYIPTYESRGYNHLLSLIHTINASTFHELRMSYYTNRHEKSKYKDPFDQRYISGIHREADVPGDIFEIGLVDPGFTYRKSISKAIKYDITSQIHKVHLVKLGVELREHNMQDEYFVVRRDEGTNWELRIDNLNSMAHNYYNKKPLELSSYLQDKIEIQDFIINAGIRFDYFDAKSYIPLKKNDPSNKRNITFNEAYKKVDPKMQLSPRIGMAFPVSADGSIHASYGQFFQIPELGRLYENPEFEVIGTFESFIGNADLNPQRTTIYEIGFQQKVTPQLILDATCYYKDIRNLAGTSLYKTFDQVQYGQYTNYDYGNVWGITLAFDLLETGTLSSTLDYTYQVADGNGSDPKQAFYNAANKDEANKTLISLDWDQRHVLNWVVNLSAESWGITTITRFQSGFPYTPTTAFNLSENVQLRNSARRKPEFNVDIRLYKDISFVGLTTTLFLKVENLFDQTLNEYLPELTQRDYDSHKTKEFLNSLYDFRYDPERQPAPRLVKLGLSINI